MSFASLWHRALAARVFDISYFCQREITFPQKNSSHSVVVDTSDDSVPCQTVGEFAVLTAD